MAINIEPGMVVPHHSGKGFTFTIAINGHDRAADLLTGFESASDAKAWMRTTANNMTSVLNNRYVKELIDRLADFGLELAVEEKE